jgi:tight adherence protein B
MEIFVLGAFIFVVAVVVIELLGYAVRNMRSAQRARIRKRLRRYSFTGTGSEGEEILKKRIYSDIPWLNDLLNGIPFIHAIDRQVIQANAKYPVGFYLLLSVLLAICGYYVGYFYNRNVLQGLMIAAVFFSLPYVWLNRQKAQRLQRFKRQLPDTLDLIARALKAGHAFTGGLSMVSEEFDDPIGPEFAETLDEINYGVSVPDALKNLSGRIDCEELKYFIVGVILQRETGGNLAELMGTLADLIRERFKFEGKVRTLTAEGRFSAVVLILLPLLLAAYLYVTNPTFLDPLFKEDVGNLMALLALVGMVVGALVMRRMVKIEV